ncbi:MAG: RNA polymerase factor sigma-54 [Alphaproteobacteria bacterium]|nr:RNA polymerase factor sigma-54 [Alphaproteobacteria bacterium]
MAVAPKLEIKQSQSLLMTPQLRQAINLLQMNNLELSELVTKELESNPFLEKEDDRIADSDTKEQTIDDYDNQLRPEEENFAEDIDFETTFDDADSDSVGYNNTWTDHLATRNFSEDDFDYIEQRATAENSIYELLSRQINSCFSSAKEKMIASYLSNFLDNAGYFTGNIEQLAKHLKLSQEKLNHILSILQTFEPSGIFATSLKECLSIQLADIDRLDEMMKIFLEHLPLLAENKITALKKICHASDEDIASMIADIKALNPKPLAQYHKDSNTYIIPDVFVRRSKYGDYSVTLNQDTLPHILINNEYHRKISNNADKQAKKYIKERLSNASFLVKALHQRAETILRISEEIVKTQRDFFEYGIDHLKPMLLKDVAQAVEMHESTISRASTHKYMHTPIGIFELKYFFSSAAGMYNGNTQTSVTSIKHKIKQLIDNEGDKILSDDALVELLAQQSIKIARRTVAKYRDEMKIPTSAQRKRLKRG